MLSHGNLLANAQHNLAATGHRPDQRWLHVCPMFHVAGIANLLACTWVGRGAGAAPALRRRRGARDDRARADHPHRARADDARDAARRAGRGRPPTSRSLRHVQYAASPISAELQRRVLERLPDCDVAQFYGMTEAAPTVTHLTARGPPPRRRAPRLGRRAGAGRRGRGARADGEPASCGSAGRTSCSATGTAPTRPPRRSSTAGTAPATSSPPTSDGYLYLRRPREGHDHHGRRERLLARGRGGAAAPPGGRRGRRVRACPTTAGARPSTRSSSPREPVTADALLDHCRDHIAGFKVPREIELRDEPLPKSGAGKVLKTQLREPFWEGRERRVS